MSSATFKACRLLLPLPPSVNSYWIQGRTRSGRRNARISDKGKRFRVQAIAAIMEQRAERFGSVPVVVDLEIHPRPQGGDIDNFSKGTLDAITHAGLWDDDSQVIDLRLRRRRKTAKGIVVVFIREATTEEIEESCKVSAVRPSSWGGGSFPGG